jgi:hypothetical protein
MSLRVAFWIAQVAFCVQPTSTGWGVTCDLNPVSVTLAFNMTTGMGCPTI